MAKKTIKNVNEDNKWLPQVMAEAKKWSHRIFLITGEQPSRRSIVIWSCQNHPESGTYVFTSDDKKLEDLRVKGKLSASVIEELLALYPGEPFYASRMDEYLKTSANPRTTCCREKLHGDRTVGGYQLFKKLLVERGKHYKTIYTLLIGSNEYKGKHVKCPIKCETHSELDRSRAIKLAI